MQAGKKTTESKPTGTDWERVKREAAQNAPVPFDPAADKENEPYDPNAAAAVAAYWKGATIRRGRGRTRRRGEAPDLEYAS